MRAFVLWCLPLTLAACRSVVGAGDKVRSNVESDASCSDTPEQLKSDSKNCGRCFNDCLGEACNAGVCAPKVYGSSEISGTVIKLMVDHERLIWSEYGEKTATNRVAATNKNLSDPTTDTLVWIDQAVASDLRLDEDEVWWSEYSFPEAPPNTAHVGRVAKDGSNPYTFPQTFGDLFALELGPGAVYLAGSSDGTLGFIQRLSLEDQKLTSLYESSTPSAARSLAIDDTYLYYSDFLANQIARLPLASGPPEVLYDQTIRPYPLVLSGEDLFFLDQTSVFRLPKNGAASVLGDLPYSNESAHAVLAVDAESVYFAQETPQWITSQNQGPYGIVGKFSRTQSSQQAVTLAEMNRPPSSIALDDAAVYVGGLDTIVRIPK